MGNSLSSSLGLELWKMHYHFRSASLHSLCGYWCPDLSTESPRLEETFEILQSQHQPSRAMSTPNPRPMATSRPLLDTPRHGGSIPCLAANPHGVHRTFQVGRVPQDPSLVNGTGRDHTHSLGCASSTWAHPRPWAFSREKRAELCHVLGRGSTGAAAPALGATPCHSPGAALHPPLLLLTLCLGITWCQSAAFGASPELCYIFLAVSPFFRVFLCEPAHAGHPTCSPGQVWKCYLFVQQQTASPWKLKLKRFPYSESCSEPREHFSAQGKVVSHHKVDVGGTTVSLRGSSWVFWDWIHQKSNRIFSVFISSQYN